ncbi:MAG: tetratricopeptide repeat protein [Proteobacteria bacterium]|nr:tetratricopeptide repeat protein [Pseudomonadota bacterium]
MKSLFVSSWLVGSALAADVEDGFQCLGWTDLACAVEVVEDLGDDASVEAELLRARVDFHSGRSAEAAERMGTIVRRADELDLYQLAGEMPGGRRMSDEHIDDVFGEPGKLKQELEEDHAMYVATAEAQSDLVESRIGDVVVLHHPGIERILVEDAAEAIQLGRERIAPLLGGDVPGVVRVEIYPDTASFTAASGLPADAVRTTGVVAISKWNRLVMSSPRALGKGYGWRDTLVHEWIHYVVSYNSHDQAPIWLQEGLAKSTEMLWRQDDFELEVQKQSLLAGALQTGEWITFEQMHPSMAYLPTAEAASLAYAQVSTMMEYLQVSTDRQALSRVIALVKDGEDSKDAVADVAGVRFSKFEDGWKAWLAEQDLVGERIATVPTVLDGGDEFEYDPVLSRRRDLSNRARLGDLMLERDHPEAALTYYLEAKPEDEPPSPYLQGRLAQVYVELGRPGEAQGVLESSLRLYPDNADNNRLYAELLHASGDDAGALEHYLHAAEINPFSLPVQQALSDLYTSAGDGDRAARHARYVRILQFRDEGPDDDQG